jgi:phosphate starvation-inducible PhoH-like protein
LLLNHSAEKTIKIRGVNPVILLGANDSNLRILEKNFASKIVVRGDTILLKGESAELEKIEEVFTELIFLCHKKSQLDAIDVETVIRLVRLGQEAGTPEPGAEHEQEVHSHHKNLNSVVLFTHKDYIEVKTEGQKEYVKQTQQNDVVFAIGPAGTGKTYLAVALAVASLKNKEVERIVLSRPAVETGESLGFLPGDLRDKIDPYLRPLYDALHDMIPSGKIKTYMEQGIIEIVPLAFMRGRTLNNAFVILDEAQNTTPTQMKMFLTRLGANSKAIITGDVTQSDLPRSMTSGLREVEDILTGIDGIAFVYFSKQDVVRHRLVREIIEAYDNYDDSKSTQATNLSIQRGRTE